MATPKTDSNYAFIEQIGDDTFVISGGEKNEKRLTFIDSGSINEY